MMRNVWKLNFIPMMIYLQKTLKRYVMMIIFIRSVFYEGGKSYPQIFLDEYFYKL